jgi:hypothetical protein
LKGGMMMVNYQIKVKGHVDDKWSDWFNGLTISHQEDGTTMLYGPLLDQTALHSVLNKIRDMNLPLILVQLIEERKQ